VAPESPAVSRQATGAGAALGGCREDRMRFNAFLSAIRGRRGFNSHPRQLNSARLGDAAFSFGSFHHSSP